ncbi:TetR/AcrR family transcriptional regulator [Reichenbachiella versicolor]|uniref:TetR/AcrR family transcriptional regulator n=1 Tax=Reichenbachiella versicolor TaxID=1821036 RepID=UPI000D6DD361|nr:TetR/AcrR family transcriptional regulator [Reichenbachiella versicolor]
MNNGSNARDRILDAAEKIFHSQGYGATGISEIIKEAGIARGSLYYNFSGKDSLCVAYLRRRHLHWKSAFEEFLKSKHQKVLAAFDFLMKDNDENDFRGCSFLNILSETPKENIKVFKEIQQHKIELRSYFEKWISDADLAFTVYALFENAIIESQIHRNQEPVIRTKKIVAQMLKEETSTK